MSENVKLDIRNKRFFWISKVLLDIRNKPNYSEYCTLCLKKTVHFCFCHNFDKFPPILIIFGGVSGKVSEILCSICIVTSLDPCHRTTFLNADVPNFYLTLDLLQLYCSLFG